jgi:hypothetical protein
MGELFTPTHLIVIFIFAGIFFIAKGGLKALRGKATAAQGQTQDSSVRTALPDVGNLPIHKYCSECGKQILRRAEICPLCGCRVT